MHFFDFTEIFHMARILSSAISYARGAAAKLYVTIDRIPSIDNASPDGLKLESVSGQIEFDHVQFTYPSRQNVPVIKDLNVSFEAGKTSALVGASGSGKRYAISLPSL